jgi:hypothetical protein
MQKFTPNLKDWALFLGAYVDPESYHKMFFFNEKEYSDNPLCGLLPWFDIITEKKLWNFDLVSVYLVPVRNEG